MTVMNKNVLPQLKAVALLMCFLTLAVLMSCSKPEHNEPKPMDEMTQPLAVAEPKPLDESSITVTDISIGMSNSEVSSLLEKKSSPDNVKWKPFGLNNENVWIFTVNEVEWFGIKGTLEIKFKEANNKVKRMEWIADGKATQSDYNNTVERIKSEYPNSESTSGSNYQELVFTWKENKRSYDLIWSDAFGVLRLITPAETIFNHDSE
jgi:hypothetical protein